jgi:hypothetical protein
MSLVSINFVISLVISVALLITAHIRAASWALFLLMDVTFLSPPASLVWLNIL